MRTTRDGGHCIPQEHAVTGCFAGLITRFDLLTLASGETYHSMVYDPLCPALAQSIPLSVPARSRDTSCVSF